MSDIRYLLLAEGFSADPHYGKTALGVLRYRRDDVVAILDSTRAGEVDDGVPVVGSVNDALCFNPTTALVGVATQGGRFPPEWIEILKSCIAKGLDVENGLHVFLADDPVLAELAARYKVELRDLRRPPSDLSTATGANLQVPGTIVLTVGSDCAIGKMTVSLELDREARSRGLRSIFVPTGQTGIAIAGWGTSVDRVIADFASGASEQLVLEGDRRIGARDGILFVEGQGGIVHPGYAPVTLALLYGCAPDALVLVHLVTRTKVDGYDIPIPGYRTLIRTYEGLCANVKPAQVVAIALNTNGLDDAAARAAIADASEQTGLPCDDVLRFGPDALYAVIAGRIGKTAVLTDG